MHLLKCYLLQNVVMAMCTSSPNELCFGGCLQSFHCLGWNICSAFVTRNMTLLHRTKKYWAMLQFQVENSLPCLPVTPIGLAVPTGSANESLIDNWHTDQHFVQNPLSLNNGQGPFELTIKLVFGFAITIKSTPINCRRHKVTSFLSNSWPPFLSYERGWDGVAVRENITVHQWLSIGVTTSWHPVPPLHCFVQSNWPL